MLLILIETKSMPLSPPPPVMTSKSIYFVWVFSIGYNVLLLITITPNCCQFQFDFHILPKWVLQYFILWKQFDQQNKQIEKANINYIKNTGRFFKLVFKLKNHNNILVLLKYKENSIQ